jgi:hypothetical protein
MTDKIETDYLTTYRDTWADLVETNGQLDRDKVARELHDYAVLLREVPLAYDAVTGGRLSKPNTSSVAIEQAAAEFTNSVHAAGLLHDLLPQMAHEADRQAVIDFAMELDAESYTDYLNAQSRKAAVRQGATS